MRLLRPLHPVLRRAYTWWSRRPRRFRRDGFDLLVLPGVFHPGLFHSSGTLARHVAGLPLQGRSFLELGAGTGLVALTAARAGALVTASDINPAAIKNLRLNSERNGLPITVQKSDLFEDLPMAFDVIAINPPYYPHDPRDDAQRAFYSGTGHTYFLRLFPQLARRIAAGAEVWMVLSQDARLATIHALAHQHGLLSAPARTERHWGEGQVVFRLVLERT